MAVRTLLSIGISVGILIAAANRSAMAEPTELSAEPTGLSAEPTGLSAEPTGLSAGPTVPLAEPKGLQSGVAHLLQLGEKYSPHSLASAQKQHDLLAKLPGYDARVQYAFALVLIKQRSTDRALEMLGETLAKQPDMLPAWRAKVWVQVSARKYTGALETMRAATKVVARQQAAAAQAPALQGAPDAGADERAATARFFGRVCGFLEGPRAHEVPAELMRKNKQYIQQKLGDDREAFIAGEESIAEEFALKHQRLQAARSESAAEQAEKQAVLKQQEQRVDKAEADVDFKAEKLQTDTKAQLDGLTESAVSIQKNILQAQFRLNGIDQAIAAQQGLLTIQNAQLNQPGNIDAFTRAAAIRQLGLIQNNLQQLALQRAALAMQIAGLNQQLGAAAGQRDSLLGHSEQTSSELKSQAGQLKRKEKELARAQKAAAKGHDFHGGAARALTEQQAFGTYESFPFELEKERVLHWFQP